MSETIDDELKKGFLETYLASLEAGDRETASKILNIWSQMVLVETEFRCKEIKIKMLLMNKERI